MSLSKETGYQHLDELPLNEHSLVKCLIINLKEYPFMVKLFRMVAPKGGTDWVITNELDHPVNLFVAEIRNDREFKQLTGSEKCQCRKASSQRNHLACHHAWVSLRVKAKRVRTTVHQVRQGLFTGHLVQQLRESQQ